MSHHRLLMQHLILMAPLLLLGPICSADIETPSQSAPTIALQNYNKLHDLLIMYQAAAANPWPIVPSLQALKPDMVGNTIIILRERLRRSNDLASENDTGSNVYDASLVHAVEVFQDRHGLTPDGVVGNDTFAALNVSPEERVKQIEKNMERWAALSKELKSRYIMINIPDFHLDLIDHDQKVLSMKVIVGKPDWPTPELQSEVTRIVFNPYWNVPDPIARKDIIPKMQADPNYLNENNIRIFTSQESDATEIDPNDVNWYTAQDTAYAYHFRQEPGEMNSLGLVKFEFDNQYSVYMHDTPAKNLFDAPVRAFSHGCVRLENPFAIVDYLLQNDARFGQGRVQEIISEGNTKYINVENPIPIIITYITAWVDENGVLQFRNDIYGIDDPTAAVAKENSEEAVYY